MVGPGDPCTDGTSMCIGNSRYFCGSNGTWAHDQDCTGVTPRCATSGSTATCQCTPGTIVCHQNRVTLLRCNADGTFDGTACGQLEVCSVNRCISACTATQFGGDCIDITTRRACVDDTLVAVPCGAAFVCFQGQCVPNNT